MKKRPYLYTYASSWKEHGGRPGLVQYALDLEKGQLTPLNTITERDSMNCSYVDQEKGMLYVCNEDIRVRGADAMSGQIVGYRLDPQSGAAEEAFRKVTYCPNAVAVFRIDPATGLLTLVENVAVRGVRPRALALTPDGDFLLAGCLVSGDITVFRVKEDGTLDGTGGTAVQKGVSYFSFYQPKDVCEARCEYES